MKQLQLQNDGNNTDTENGSAGEELASLTKKTRFKDLTSSQSMDSSEENDKFF